MKYNSILYSQVNILAKNFRRSKCHNIIIIAIQKIMRPTWDVGLDLLWGDERQQQEQEAAEGVHDERMGCPGSE